MAEPELVANADGTLTPRPDPTTRTIETLAREVATLGTAVDLKLFASNERLTAETKLAECRFNAAEEARAAIRAMMEQKNEATKELLGEKFEAAKELLGEKFEGRDKALLAALEAAKEAVGKAELASEKRFDTLTKLVADQNAATTLLLPRAEYEGRIADLDRRLSEISRTVDKGFTGVDIRQVSRHESRDSLRQTWGLAIALLTVLLTIGFLGLGLATYFANR